MYVVLTSKTNRLVLLSLMNLAVLSLLASFIAHAQSGDANWYAWSDGALQNFGTEMLGAIATFIFFEVVIGGQRRADEIKEATRQEEQAQAMANRREIERKKDAELREKEEIARDKKRLKRQAGSVNHAIAINAVEELRENDWLTTDGEVMLLMDADLRRANLEKAPLSNANLNNSDLEEANLSESNLRYATLINTNFRSAILVGANLVLADLSSAKLGKANLSHAKLGKSNLSGAKLSKTILAYSDLSEANLAETKLWDADLSGAELKQANLHNAKLYRVNLQGAMLRKAQLQDSLLRHVNLNGAVLREADLSGADLTESIFDETTVLPDAEYLGKDDEGNEMYDKYWTPDVDMTRYTNPNHEEFWQPEWAK